MQETKSPRRVILGDLQVTPSWRNKFLLINKAGGPRLPDYKSLSFGERFSLGFNVLAFLFGPFYYLAKGMWRKALFLFGVGLAVIILIGLVLDSVGMSQLANSIGYGVPALFAVRANVDYYKKMVLGDDGWW